MCVKAWKLPEAANNITPLLGDDTLVVPLENGIDAPEVLTPIMGASHVVGGLCAIVSFIVAPSHIRHAAYEPMVMLASWPTPAPRASNACATPSPLPE